MKKIEKIKRTFESLSLKGKNKKKKTDVKTERSGAEILTERTLKNSSSGSSGSSHVKSQKDEQKSSIHSRVNSPRATTRTKKNCSLENNSGKSEISSGGAHQAEPSSGNHQQQNELKEIPTKSRSNVSPRLEPQKNEQKSPIHSPVNSRRATTKTKENKSGEPEISSGFAHQANLSSSNHQQMVNLFATLRHQYENISHEDLIKVFCSEMKKNAVAISQKEIDSFLKNEKTKWDLHGDLQLAKWKRNYSQAEHDVVNLLDREACYTTFSELSKKYKIKTDKSGGKYMDFPKGVTAEDARKEITAFIRSEKAGAEFRWKESPDLANKILGFNQRLNVTDEAFFGHYSQLCKAFVADPGFQRWNENAEHTVSTKTAPTLPRATTASPFSKTLRSEFVKLHLKHISLTRKNEGIYTPGENGRDYLSAFIVGEVKRNPGYVGWPEDAKKAFCELLDAFQNKEELFNPTCWSNFREIMLNDPVVRHEVALAQQQQRRKAASSNDVIVPEPLTFKDPEIKHLLEPHKYSKADFLSLSYEKHGKTAETFDEAVRKVTKEAVDHRSDITRFDIENHLLSKRQHFHLQKD